MSDTNAVFTNLSSSEKQIIRCNYENATVALVLPQFISQE